MIGRIKITLADIVLVWGSVACLLALFYCVYWYVWTQEREFTGAADIIIKIVLPGLLGTVLLASLRFRSQYKVHLAKFCIFSLLSVYIAELLLQLGPHVDIRTNLEVVSEFRSRGIDAVPAPFPSALVDLQRDGNLNSGAVLPLGGIAKKLTVLCNETGQWITYKSDEHGFNNPDGVWQSRHISIAAVGDSFVFGKCVPPDKNVVALIWKDYPATLNLGMNGAGPLKELAAVKEYLPHFKPKVTLWFYFELNDLTDLAQETRSGFLKRYLKGNFNQGLITRQTEIDQVLSHYANKKIEEANNDRADLEDTLKIIKLSTVRTKSGLVNGTSQTQPDELHIKLFREVLQDARAFVGTWNGLLYFVYLPAWQRYTGRQATSVNRDTILNLVRRLNIPVIDIHESFQAHSDPLRLFPFRQQGHYNEEGHRLVAETILRHLSLRFSSSTTGRGLRQENRLTVRHMPSVLQRAGRARQAD